VSLVERKTGFTLIEKVERKTAQAVSRAMVGLLKPYRGKVHTITSDNGREFAAHEEIAKQHPEHGRQMLEGLGWWTAPPGLARSNDQVVG